MRSSKTSITNRRSRWWFASVLVALFAYQPENRLVLSRAAGTADASFPIVSFPSWFSTSNRSQPTGSQSSLDSPSVGSQSSLAGSENCDQGGTQPFRSQLQNLIKMSHRTRSSNFQHETIHVMEEKDEDPSSLRITPTTSPHYEFDDDWCQSENVHERQNDPSWRMYGLQREYEHNVLHLPTFHNQNAHDRQVQQHLRQRQQQVSLQEDDYDDEFFTRNSFSSSSGRMTESESQRSFDKHHKVPPMRGGRQNGNNSINNSAGRNKSAAASQPYSLGVSPVPPDTNTNYHRRNRNTSFYQQNKMGGRTDGSGQGSSGRRRTGGGTGTAYPQRSYSRHGGRSNQPPFPPAYDDETPNNSFASSSQEKKPKNFVRSAIDWVREGNVPKIQVRVEPNTTLKLRKRFRPLKTVVMLGADFNTQLGVWQFKSSWEDRIIGGRLTLAGRELQLSKTWLLSVGAVDDLVTRLRFRASVDLGTGRAYARFGFRTERFSPINVVEGFTLVKQLPLDGNRGNVKLEVKANFGFPEPEIEYSTENHRSVVGMGDIEVNIDELNLLLDY